jgi:hypothetical protein
MKVIAPLQGIAAIRVLPEEILPSSTPPLLNIVFGVKSYFNFSVAPGHEAIVAGNPLIFQSGRIVQADKEIGIHQLFMLPDGDIVLSSNTDFAEEGLQGLIRYLNEAFGYRMTGQSARTYYQSTVVVEFEKPFSESIPSIARIQQLLSRANSGHEHFEMLRLSFVRRMGEFPNVISGNPLDGIEKSEFTIERRAGSPFSSNRFYCTAPLRTKDHIDALQELEQALS